MISPSAQLDIEQVRRLAQDLGFDELQHNKESKVIAFCSPSDGTRFNVYYTTGTVGTCLDHPRQGTTQLFRRNVNLEQLQNIFRNPRVHTGYGYHQSLHDDEKRWKTTAAKFFYHQPEEHPIFLLDEENAALEQIRKLRAERLAIDQELEELQAILDDINQKRQEEIKQRHAEEKKRAKQEKRRQQEAKLEQERQERGLYGIWKDILEADKEEDDFDQTFDKTVTCVALGKNGSFLCLRDSGKEWKCSPGLPDDLHRLLEKRRLTSQPAPVYVSMGCEGQYYIQYEDGKSEWVGPKDMTRLLNNKNNQSRAIRSVAFGVDWGTFFIVWDDGDYNWAGNIPHGLEEKLKERGRRSDLDKVTLGPNLEWSLWAKNGRAWWDGNDSFLDDIASVRDDITDIVFGGNGAYFIRHQ